MASFLSRLSPRTDWFLGPYGSAEISKTFVLPSDHTQAKLQANFHFLDGWDEQIAYMKINGKVVWQQGHSMCSTFSVIPELTEVCLQKGINACGGEGTDLIGGGNWTPIRVLFQPAGVDIRGHPGEE